MRQEKPTNIKPETGSGPAPSRPPESPSPTPKADGHAPSAVACIEVDFDVVQHKMEIRSKSATIVIEGAVGEALAAMDVFQPAPLPADNVVRLVLEFDLLADRLVRFDAQAPRVIMRGILHHVLGALTRNQQQQSIALQIAPLQKQLNEIGMKLAKTAGGRLVLPGGAA